MTPNKNSFPCPHCGTELPAKATSCKECGSDGLTGWSKDAQDSGADIPSEYSEEDYNNFIQKEFGKGSSRYLSGWFVIILLLIVLLIFLMIFFR